MKRFGKQKPRFKFFLNPYADMRLTRCPQCENKTKLRKLPLMIHVEPDNFLALNKTCRYCPYCDLLIAHQDEIEAYLAAYFAEHQPDVVGNDYLVVGTFDRPNWQKGVNAPVPVTEMLDYLHDFKQVLNFKVTGGWMPKEEAEERGSRHKA
jgi:hypothetical protein